MDDGSTDGTRRRIDELIRSHPDVIKLVSAEKNMGPARARNTGAAVAKGDHLFFLGSDTEVLPDSIGNFREFRETYREP